MGEPHDRGPRSEQQAMRLARREVWTLAPAREAVSRLRPWTPTAAYVHIAGDAYQRSAPCLTSRSPTSSNSKTPPGRGCGGSTPGSRASIWTPSTWGVTYLSYEPGVRSPMAHSHHAQEGAYIVTGGSGTIVLKRRVPCHQPVGRRRGEPTHRPHVARQHRRRGAHRGRLRQTGGWRRRPWRPYAARHGRTAGA